MITVRALNASEVIVSGPEAVRQWRERHTLFVPGHEHTPRFKFGSWDGKITTGKWCKARGDLFELRCSRGLVPRIVKDLGVDTSFDFVGAILKERAAEWCTRNEKFGTLRDYQQRAFKGIIRDGWGRIAFATNAGKGAVIAMLAAFGRDHMLPVLILCDELAVFDALQGEIKEWAGFVPGLVGRGSKIPPASRVTLAMIPTLARRIATDVENDGGEWLDWLKSIQMMLVDEADKAKGAATWRMILDAATSTVFRAGFSGTFPKDLFGDLRLDEVLGPVIDRVTNSEMVERGVSARPLIEVRAFDATPSLFPLPRHFWRLPTPARRLLTFEKAVIYNQARHEFVRSLIRPDALTAIVVNRIEHGRQLQDAIPGSVFLDGSTSEAERIAALTQFEAGATRVIIITKILDRGSNRLGHTTDLIFASGEGSTTQTLQRIGRGLRRAGGKEYLRLVDVMDRVQHNSQSDKRVIVAATYLHAAVRRRLQVYGDQGFDIAIHGLAQ